MNDTKILTLAYEKDKDYPELSTIVTFDPDNQEPVNCIVGDDAVTVIDILEKKED